MKEERQKKGEKSIMQNNILPKVDNKRNNINSISSNNNSINNTSNCKYKCSV